ncbi:hypothetical protein SSP531S_30060 [Streptomyces spongiicola]|uniref:CdiI immunity protein domain-containing protein n=1 Tax=Streptomyces spongiicola TaxID=1690221 RepID=A0A2S1Z3H0_9ACTN|nr:hypothetical protein [Streptomyces spongiicola]AWK10905.1 hypothetical protein DDQ41_20560 [Streptomyces spongiicola]GBQ01567.1 hypothetical protein SSP531S_30060 [Streptomyces spongiicola]
MPGSTTLGPGHGADAIEHPDAQRLASVMKELHRLLTAAGPDRITDPQVAELCGGEAHRREEFTDWVDRVAHQLEKAVSR